MAIEEGLITRSVVMAADYSAKQYMACVLDSTGKGAVPSAGGSTYGVVQNIPTTGQVGTVAIRGTTKMVAGAAVAAGALVMADSQGRAVAATSTNYAIGTARVAAAGAGVVISVELENAGKV